MSKYVLGYLEVQQNTTDQDTTLTEGNSTNPYCYPHRFQILRHSILKLGRYSKQCSIFLSSPNISSIHCIFYGILFDDTTFPLCYVRDCSLNGTYLNNIRLTKNDPYLLQANDLIDFKIQNDNLVLKFIPIENNKINTISLTTLGFRKYVDEWVITPHIIGTGTFGHVLVTHKKDSIQHYAVKIVKMKPNKLDKEAQILLNLNHPNIIKIHFTFQDMNLRNLYIFQDLISGGDLFSYLARGTCLTPLPETEALFTIYQILIALQYLHSQNIVHRDLKLDNILMVSPEPYSKIVLADFGIARINKNIRDRMLTVVGTPEYCAPEVGFRANRKIYNKFSRAATLEQRKDGYNQKCDIWSLGVITHIILTGISPFYGDGTEISIIENAKNGLLNFNVKQWDNCSLNSKDFVSLLLRVNVNIRLNANQALKHIWISKHETTLKMLYKKKT